MDEDWDGDFADDLKEKLHPAKLTTYKPIPSFTNNNDLSPTISISSPTPVTGTVTRLNGSLNKKPFELLKVDAPHRRSFQMLPVERKPTKIVRENYLLFFTLTRLELYK